MTDPWFLVCIAIAALAIGVSKAGFSGVSMVSVALLAEAFALNAETSVLGSVGFALPMLIVADLTVYPAFRKWGSWREVWPLLVPMLVGVGVGYLWIKCIGIPEDVAKPLIGSIIAIMLVLQIWKKYGKKSFDRMAYSRAFGGFAGIAGGIATTLANAAGPVMQLFLLSRGFPKMEMVGIGARLFLVVNLVKVPLLGNAGLITQQSLLLNLAAVPFIWTGIWLGKRYLLKVPQKAFEWMILSFATIAAVKLLLF